MTGGAGYVGSILTPALIEAGHQVTVLDNFMYQQSSLLECCASERFTVIRGDCRDRATLEGALHEQDAVIALAALVGAPLCSRDQVGAVTTNLDAIRLLIETRSPDQLVLFPNTNSGYGIGDRDAACTEESPLRPLSLYGRTKVQAEQLLLDAGNAISFRLATVFGVSPRMRIDLMVNDFVYRAVHDRALVLFEGGFRRNFVHVRDVARVFLHGLANHAEMRGRVYNVGLDEANLTKRQLCERIREHVPEFRFVEEAIGEDPDKRDYVVSNAKIAATGFCPRYSLDGGIAELVKGYTVLKNVANANA